MPQTMGIAFAAREVHKRYVAITAGLIEQDSGEIDLPEDVTIGVCYPDPVPTVQRTVVIGERLITITERDLLSSDLATLAPGPFVDL